MENHNVDITIDACSMLTDLLKRVSAEENRGISFLYSQDREVFLSYHKLYYRALHVLHNLQAHGVQPGNEVVLMLEDNLNFVIFFWACLLGKIVPVPLPAGNQEDHKYKLTGVWNVLTHPFLVSEQSYYDRLKRSLGQQQPENLEKIAARYMDAYELLTEIRPGLPETGRTTDVAYIQFSSGSTGTPKGVTLTHENLLTNIRDIISRSRTTAADKSLSWMPLSHDMGLICFHLSSLAAGIDQYVMDTALFIRNPVLWMEKASRNRISQLYSPNFGYHYLLTAIEGKAAGEWDLTAIRIIYNGAEPISYELCNRFCEKLSAYGLHRNAMFPGYGLAEASVAVALPDVNDPLKVHFLDRVYCNIGDHAIFMPPGEGIAFVENGYPLDSCAVRICGEAYEVYEDGRIGHIQIKGGNVTQRYYNNSTATRELLTPDGWLRTGDLGFLYNGRLTVTGRAKHIIIINGQNYYPQDIEGMICSVLPAFDLGKVVACGIKEEQAESERLVIFLLYKGDTGKFVPYARAVKEIVLEKAGLVVHAVVPVRKIPKTTSGKIQHFKLAALYRQGAFSEICNKLDQWIEAIERKILPNHLSILEKLELIWKGVLGMQPVPMDKSLFTTGLNSLIATRFTSYIQRLLQTDIAVSELFQYPSLNLLADRLKSLNTAVQIPILPVEEQDHYACTDIQQRFWLLQQLDVNTTAYNLSSGFIIEGELDLQAFAKAITALRTQFDILRTTFVNLNGTLRQKVNDSNSCDHTVSYVDLRNAPDNHEHVDQLCLHWAQQPFDLERGPLMRCCFYQLEETRYLFFFSIHHIVADGWSVNMMTDRLKALYKQYHRGTDSKQHKLPLQFSDYAAYRAKRRNMQLHQSYWKEMLAGNLTGVEFPFGKPRRSIQTFPGNAVKSSLSLQLTSAMQDFCQERGITEFMLLCAVLRVLLFRYTGQQDIVIGTDTAGRTHPDLEEQLGCFLNTLPLRLQVDPGETFDSLLQKEKTGILQALEHQDYPFDKMIVDTQPGREYSRTPIFNVLLLFRNLEGTYSFEGLDDSLEVQPVAIPVITSMVDLELECFYERSTLSLQLRFNTDLFDLVQMERMICHFTGLLERILAAPQIPVAAIDMLNMVEKEQVYRFGQGEIRPVLFGSVIHSIEQRVAEHPDAVALKFEGTQFTFAELNRQANMLAHFLIRQKGVRPENRIGVLMERSPQMIIALLAILKAGAVYVPLDTAFPAERILFISSEAGLQWLLCDQYSREFVPAGNVIILPEMNAEGVLTEDNDPGVPLKGEDIAYILYTSGSTGQPKGVMIRHESLANYIQTFIQYFKITSQDRVIQQSSLVFDISLEEIFSALCTGATLLILKDGGRNVEALLQTVEEENATILSTTPLVIREINEQAHRISNLRILISGGDSLKPTYIDQIIPQVELYNTYGPTETTVCVTYNKITSLEDTEIIGAVLPMHRIYLLDEQFNPVPVGIAGQICVSGKGLAKGYVNSILDSAVFIEHPDIPGERLYLTGDIGMWTENGHIRFLGRKDTQLKWNGYRIEAREVETKILLHEGVNDAIVKLTGQDGKQRLAAYLVATAPLDVEALRMFLSEHLPAYMIPASFVVLDQLPVNASGKVDLKALPEPENGGSEMMLPSNGTEAALLNIWQEVLKQENISVLSSFFDLGGNSLKATQIIARLRQTFSINLSLRDLLRHPTIRSMARLVSAASPTVAEDIKVTEQRAYYPLSMAQKRLWVLHRLEENPVAYNLCWSFVIKGAGIDLYFEKALEALVQRHENLRTTFIDIKGEPFMVVHDEGMPALSRLNLLVADAATWNQIATAESRTPFSLEEGPLFRVKLAQLQPDLYGVIFTIHHIITDGWSMEIIWKELDRLLQAYSKNTTPALEPLRISYKDYTAWQQRLLSAKSMAAHEDYWRKRFQGEIPLLNFHSFPLTPSEEGYRGRKMQFPLSAERMEQLAQIARSNETTLFTVLLAVWKLILFKFTGQQQIVIATPTAGRSHPELENQVGYYLNMLPLSTVFNPALSFDALLGTVKQTVEEAFEHQDYPVEKLMAHLEMEKYINRNPLFDVILVFQNFGHLRQFTGRTPFLHDIEEIDNGTSIGSLLIEFSEHEQKPVLNLRYNTDIFNEARITRIACCFERICAQLAADLYRPLYQYSILTDEERHWILHGFSSLRQVKYPFNTVTGLLDRAAHLYPGRIALQCGEKQLTYQGLHEQVNRLAKHLYHLGVAGPGKRIGILLERSENLIISILAVLKAGAAYIPLDPEYPAERIGFMINHSAVSLLITESACLQQTSLDTVAVLDIAELPQWTGQEGAVPFTAPQPHSLAYIMYTSGSTGVPKGVKISHAALADYVQTFITYFGLNEKDRVIQQSSPAFDVSVEEIFPALCCGGTVLVLPEGGRDTDRLAHLIAQQQATVLSTTPPVIAALNKQPEQLTGLRILISGGDRLTPGCIDQLLGKVAIYNTYGPTEATVCTTYHPVKAVEDAACIGKPITNREVYLLDNYLEPVPPGVAGEIYISGDGLSEGYLDMEDETRERFIKHAFKQDGLLYKTGDLGVWNENGSLWFIGRMDNQVKINGYRIEKEEIEKVLLKHEAVREALVLSDSTATGTLELKAYIIAVQDIDTGLLRIWLSQLLPYYMIPAKFILLDAFPVTIHGKTDLAALLALPETDKEAAPETAWEQRLARLWSAILGKEQISRNDNFFSLGGNSIKATQLVSRLQEHWKMQLPLKNVFLYPGLQEMAGIIAHTVTMPDKSILPVKIQSCYDVSPSQKRIWILSQLGYDQGAYHIYAGIRLEGKLELALLDECFQQLVERHESLRTTFKIIDGELKQIIHPVDAFPCRAVYSNIGDESQQEEVIAKYVRELQEASFDLAGGPLFRIRLLQLSEEAFLLLLAIHHIVADGWSVSLLFREWEILYRAACQAQQALLPVLDFQYKDYSYFMNSVAMAEQLSVQRQYWKKRFEDNIPLLELPADYPRPRTRSNQGNSCSLLLPVAVTNKLHALALRREATLFMILLAALKALLYRYCGQEDIVIGTPVSGREMGGLENQVGCYVNTLPLRTVFSGEDTFDQLLKKVKTSVLEAFEHQSYPFDQMVAMLQKERDLSRSPLFDVMLAMQQDGGNRTHSAGEMLSAPFWIPPVTSKFDLTLYVYETGDDLRLVLEYSTDLFTENTIRRFLEHYRNLLQHITIAEETPLCRLNLLAEQECRHLLERFCESPMPYREPPLSIVDMIMAAGSKLPQHAAVIYGTTVITYEVLITEATRIARYLINEEGIGPNEMVALMMDRSEKMVMALLGILFSGAAYVPVDPAYPANRVQHIISDSAAKVVLTEQKYKHYFNDHIRCITVDQVQAANFPEGWTVNTTDSNINNLAYVIYTSGSTGKPKGIPITHRNLWSLISWAHMEFEQDRFDIVYAATSYCFDLSVFEILFPLSIGKSIRLLHSGLEIADYIKTDRNILINTVPSVMEQLLKNGVALSTVSSINLAGEPIYEKLAAQLSNSNINLRNLYGPSEDTTYSSCYLFRPQNAAVAIGKPIAGKRIYVLDEHLNLLPVGVKGEICIAGPGLTSGYLNLPALTREKFIENPFRKGETLYLTGDLGRWLPDGNLEFLDRKDHQLKIRGYRIEPAEIEHVLLQMNGVRNVVVMSTSGNAGDKYLHAYYTAEKDIDKQQMMQLLEERLPRYMIPQRITRLEAFPLTANGKIDRKWLLEHGYEYNDGNTGAYVPPATPAEKILTDIWKQVLGKDSIGVKDNFFAIGGHSLNAMQVMHGINRHFHVKVELRDIFVYPTIEQLCGIIANGSWFTENIPVLEEQDHYEPSHMQRRLWILNRLEKDSSAYNMSSVYRLEGKLNWKALEHAYLRLIRRHETLRTSFLMINGEVRQRIRQLSPDEKVIIYKDVQNEPEPEKKALQLAQAYMVRPFDLEKSPLLMLVLLQYATDKYFFVVTMHHIVSDGWSMNVIMQEILHAYKHWEEAAEAQLRPLEIQYRDFAAWQQKRLETSWGQDMKKYWQDLLSGEISVLDLPGTRPRPAVKTYNGSEAWILIEREKGNKLTSLANNTGVTLFMLLIGALKALFYRYTGHEDILIGVPANGRWHQNLENQVGFFVNTLVLRTKLNGADSFNTLLAHIKNGLLAALEHQYYPFDKLLEDLQVKRDLSRSPLFDIMAVYQDSPADIDSIRLQDVSWEELSQPPVYSKFDLTFTFVPAPAGMIVKVVYNTDIYSSGWVKQMLEHYSGLLEEVIKQPSSPLNRLDYLTSAECIALSRFNDTAVENNTQRKTLVALFEEQVAATPAAAAVIFEDRTLTYSELNEQANRIAAFLRNTCGVTPGNLVGLMMDRSEKQLAGILGILKSGAAYVPIDPAYPLARKEYIIEHSRLKVLLTEPHYMHMTDACPSYVPDAAALAGLPSGNPLPASTPEDLAYVIYTSGTTGRPKGVMVEHHSVVNLSAWLHNIIYHRHSRPLRVMVNASISFDSSVKQLFPPLLSGSALVLITEQTHKDPKSLVAALARHQIDVWDITPGYLTYILKYVDASRHFPAYTLAGGESLNPLLVKRYGQLLNDRSTLINVYGVTEATVDSTYLITNYKTDEELVPFCNIGRPLPNTNIYVLDKERKQVPVGFSGEICIAGEGVARGYLYDEQQTAVSFIRNPYGQGRLYCTGDIGKWRPDGTIEFIGRADRQVKVNGYRIELAEIEQVLLQHAGIQQVFVTTIQDQQAELQIVAYYVSNTAPEPAAIQSFLQTRLPAYMLPAWLVPVPELILNEHGKINRNALPDPRSVVGRSSSPYMQAGDEIESMLVTIWEEVLECSNISIQDNFFELGGNSLKLIRLYNSIQEVYPDKLEIHQLFSNPTISKLSGLLRSVPAQNGSGSPKDINLIEL